MSEVVAGPDAGAVTDAPTGDPGPAPSAGAMLRAAREAAGLHVAALAVALKVPVKKLEALEADRLDQLPDAVFVRALAASVCRTLKMEAAPVLDKLPGTVTPRLVPDAAGINMPFRTPGDGPGPGWSEQLTRPAMLVVLALLLGALVMILLPAARTPVPAVPREPDAVVLAAPQGIPAPPALAGKTDAAMTVDPVAPGAMASAPVAQPLVLSASPAAATVSVAPLAASLPPVVSALALPVGGGADGGIVEFHTRGPSWVEVTDARGQVVLRRVLGAGETAQAGGLLPLAVTVGRVDATQVSVRGKPLDLAPLARDNVARFEIKP